MAQRLFSIGKIPVLLDAFYGGIEKRKDDAETKVIVLSCSVTPFTAKHATAIDNGTQNERNIRSTIFDQTGNAEPRAGFPGYDLSVSIPRQDFHLFATPDSEEATMLLDHVKIRERCRATAHKDNPNAMTLTFKAVVGPCSAKELAEIQKWFRTQRFVTFSESDPSLEFEEVDADDDDEEDNDGATQPELPAHEFETDAAGAPSTAAEDRIVRQRVHSHASRSKAIGKVRRLPSRGH